MQKAKIIAKPPIPPADKVVEATSQFSCMQGMKFSESGRILVPQTVSPPARLYKYAPPNLAHIKSVIVDGQILFTNPLHFNDPFDCRKSRGEWKDPEAVIRRYHANMEAYKEAGFRSSLNLNTEKERRQHEEKMKHDSEYRYNWLQETRELILSHLNMGVFCLTCNERSAQMWAHYAGSHAGVCYRFDMSRYELLIMSESGRGAFPFFIVSPVRYFDEFPARESVELVPEGVPMEFTDKHLDWNYEKEWRAFMPDCRTPLGGQYLPPNWSACQGAGFYHHRGILDGVILGCRAELDVEKEIIEMANFRNLGVWKAMPKIAEYDFDIFPCNQHAEEKGEWAGN